MVPHSKTRKKGFMHDVQLHERAWGFESYVGKPPLEEIMQSDVVVFWHVTGKADRYTVTLHDSLKEVEKQLYQMVLRSGTSAPKKRMVRIYANQKRMIPKAVRILFEEAPD